MSLSKSGMQRNLALRWLAALATLSWLCIGSIALQACGGVEQKPPPDGSCKENTDCITETTNKVCNKNTEKCIQCLESSDCAKGELCDPKGFTCAPGCNVAADCTELKTQRPNAKIECSSRKCVYTCDQKADCSSDERCSDKQCVPNTCTEDANCGAGEKCDASKCVPKGKIAGKYQGCNDGEICEDGLKCVTYKGGTSNYCYKGCDKGCDTDEVCVKEEQFAEGHSVCMKTVTDEGAVYNYDEGTACSDKLVTVSHGSVNFGSCWKTCTDQCLGGLDCHNHPGIEDATQKFCFKKCASDAECPKGSSCKEHKKANNAFYCIP